MTFPPIEKILCDGALSAAQSARLFCRAWEMEAFRPGKAFLIACNP
jgi:hypothetical protein